MGSHAFRSATGSPRAAARPVLLAAPLGLLAALALALALALFPARSGADGAVLARADLPVQGGAPADDPDEEERVAVREATRRIMRDNCLICHSEELVAGQRLTAAQWKAEVEKMIGWGAPLPADQAAPLIAFLAESYNDKVPVPPPSRMTYDQALSTVRPEPGGGAFHGDPQRGAKLFATQCATCHGAAGQGADLGPNLLGISSLGRPAEYRAVVRDGKHRMPGFKLLLKPEQEDDILAWLRGQHYRVPAPAPPAK